MVKTSSFSYGSGSSINFGNKEPQFDRSVKTYTLSPEELEAYRNGEKGGNKMLTKEKYEKLRAEGKTNKQIAQDHYISEATIYAKKKEWAEQEKKEDKPQTDDAAVQQGYEELKEELSKALSIKTDWKEKYEMLQEDFERVNADILDWQNEIERLNNVNAELQKKYAELESACEDIEEESAELKRLKEENELLKSDLIQAQKVSENNETVKLKQKLKALEDLLPLYMG